MDEEFLNNEAAIDHIFEEAYIAACEFDSPNSPDFENVLSAELLKRGIET